MGLIRLSRSSLKLGGSKHRLAFTNLGVMLRGRVGAVPLLHRLAGIASVQSEVGGPAAASEEDHASTTLSLDVLLASAPEAVRPEVHEFLLTEGIADSSALFEALSAGGSDGIPLLLERARPALKTGAYTYLRTACLHAGGLASGSSDLHATPKSSSPAAPASSQSDDLPDYRNLRKLLDAADFGEPLPHALPPKKVLDQCSDAAKHHSVVQQGLLSDAPRERPFARALMEQIRTSWAELLTGRTSPADVLNVLFGMAEVAADVRQPAAVAEKAAVRYAAAVRHEAFLQALPQSSETQCLQAWAEVLKKQHPYLIDKLLDEEAAKQPSQAGRVSSRGSPAGDSSGNHCLLWGLGQCTRDKCSFLHSCPYNSSCGSSGGCLLRNGGGGHLQTFQRKEVKEKIIGHRFQGSSRDGRPPNRRRSRSRGRAARSGSAPRGARGSKQW